MSEKIYIAIRQWQDDEPGPDVNAVGWSRQAALEKARDLDARLPRWAAENPLIRIGVFELGEEVDR